MKEPQPLAGGEALVTGSDDRLSASLDWVIVRDGPGTWAKNADWDEYLVTVRNHSDEPVVVTSVTVTDSSETRHNSIASRKKLVKASRQTARRYKGDGIKVKAGVGGGALLVTGVLSANVGMGAGAAAVYGSSAAAGAAAGALVLAPVLVVGGVLKGVNNGKVNDEIEPSPLHVLIDYTDATGDYTLVLDTSAALNGLHLAGQE
jgi:hypothetical protein